MIIREATSQDNQQLIELTALTPMAGVISLRIDRKPDFFSLLKKRGDYKVLVALKNNRIVGSFSCAIQPSIISNKKYPIYYLGDLKVHPDFKGTPIAYRIVRSMADELKRMGADFLFCTTADGNNAVRPLLEGRMSIPAFRQAGYFRIHQLLPKTNKRTAPCIQTTGNSDELLDFYNNFFPRFSCYPVIDNTTDGTHYIWKEEDEIKAALTVYDPLSLKQNVVVSYPFLTGMILKSLNFLKKILPIPDLVQKGKPLKILYVRYYGYQPGAEQKFIAVLKKIRHDAHQRGFHLVSFTVHEKDVVVEKLIRPLSMFTFLSLGFVTSLNNNDAQLETITAGIPFEDYSLV